MTLKFRRLNEENRKNIRTLRLPDKTLVVINIALIFSCGNAGQEKCLQILNDQSHIQGYLHFYLHSSHSATITQLFLHFINLSLGTKQRTRYV
jgi:hypothetical protein